MGPNKKKDLFYAIEHLYKSTDLNQYRFIFNSLDKFLKSKNRLGSST